MILWLGQRRDSPCEILAAGWLWLSLTVGALAQSGLPACGGPSSVCTCNNQANGRAVDCSGRDPPLDGVPSAVPWDTEVLNLANNGITRVWKSDLSGLEFMRTLFFQDNVISFIESGAFDNMYRLQLLVLNNNKLHTISGSLFQHLTSIGTIDLSYNQIRRLDKTAFLTVPASRSTSGVTIKLEGNTRFRCDCDTRALRDWSRWVSTIPGLASIHWDGFTCSNAANTPLMSMRDRDFPAACRYSGQSVLEAGPNCTSCHSQTTQHACDLTASTASTCTAPESVCQSQIRYGDPQKVTITKGCTTFTQCLQAERDNTRGCYLNRRAPDNPIACTFCCTGTDCNAGDMGGRSLSLRVFVDIRLKQAFQAYMLDPRDDAYVRKVRLFTRKLTEILRDYDGGYVVGFRYFRDESPNTHLSLVVHTTGLSTTKDTEVMNWMYRQVALSGQRGFLKQQDAAHYYVGTNPPDHAKMCPREVTHTDVGSMTWEETPPDNTAYSACPATPQPSSEEGSRRCVMTDSGVAQWEAPNVLACPSKETSSTSTVTVTQTETTTTTVTVAQTEKSSIISVLARNLVELSNTKITANNVGVVLEQLDHLTSDEEALTASDVSLAMSTVEKALDRGDTLKDTKAMASTVAALNNLVEVDQTVLTGANTKGESAVKLVAAADKISAEGQLSEEDHSLLITGANLVVAAKEMTSGTSPRGLTISADPSREDGAFQEGDVTMTLTSDAQDGSKSSLVLPPSLLTSYPGCRVALTVHLTDKVFEAMTPVARNDTSDGSESADFDTQINSHVMAASLVGHDVRSLKDPVTFTLLHKNENSTNPRCVFWDTASLQWSSRGCRQVKDISTSGATVCQCGHLTNFALLMDVYRQGMTLSDRDRKALSIISYIGCGVSLMALLLTLLTYAFFRKLRRDNPSKILLNLCVAMATSNLIFVVGMHPYALTNVTGCKIVAVLLHFSLLASLCWMAVEAFYMYLALVLVFKTYFTRFLIKCSLVGWGIPFVIVVITLSVNETENYGPLDTGVCWLKEVPFYTAFVGPVCLVLALNFLVFGLVLRQILGVPGQRLSKSESFTVAQRLRGAVGVVILLGLTWVFAVFAVGRASVAFYYLFAVFNSLQGLWIFLFYCVLKREARLAWQKTLPCCPPPEDKFIISSSKAAYSASALTQHRAQMSSNDNLADTTATTFTSLTRAAAVAKPDCTQSQC